MPPGAYPSSYAHVVPKPPDAAGSQPLGDRLYQILRAGDDPDIHLMRGAEILQISQRQDADSGEHVARLPLSGIKHGDDIHTTFFKHGQVHQRAPEIPRTDGGTASKPLPDREYLADLGKQVTDICIRSPAARSRQSS